MKRLKLSNQIGLLGEGIALKRLLSLDFEFIAKNYLEKTGEIDIIVKKNNIIHFVEVKSVSCENLHLTEAQDFNPIDNVTSKKLTRLHKTIALYMQKYSVSYETRWQIDAISVYINQNSKQAKVKILWNVIA